MLRAADVLSTLVGPQRRYSSGLLATRHIRRNRPILFVPEAELPKEQQDATHHADDSGK